ncbi:NfeD family protein [Halovivax limisalsi]|uniref:NfeD family protein n=1 Tax=Halovivax limisalsi TaxID=1453760 RepID=UPI001FFC9A90|nr:NfeD family protein [Halovivax limisalsi]
MIDLLVSNAAYALLAAGLVLMAIEAVSPGAYLIVIGVALAGAGLVGVLVPGGLNILVLAVLTLAIGAAATWTYREFDFYGGKGTAQTSSSSSLAGATGYVTETVTPRSGEVKLERGGFSPYYTARTTDGTIEEGTEVIVLDPGGGNVLKVEALDSIESDGIDRALARESASDGDEESKNDDYGGSVEGERDATGEAERASDSELESERSG